MRGDSVRTLYALAGLLVLSGLVLRFAPARVAAVPAPAITVDEPTDEPSGSERAEALLSYQGIVRANVFSRDRSPPTTRYVPPELAELVAPVRTPARTAPVLRLYGVAVGPTGAVALIDADPAIPGAEVYRPGDTVAGARLVTIADTAVVLEGPAGRTILTLPTSSRRSP